MSYAPDPGQLQFFRKWRLQMAKERSRSSYCKRRGRMLKKIWRFFFGPHDPFKTWNRYPYIWPGQKSDSRSCVEWETYYGFHPEQGHPGCPDRYRSGSLAK